MGRHPLIDKDRITVLPIQQRESKVHLSDMLCEEEWYAAHRDDHADLETMGLADAIREAKANGKPVIFFLAGHVIKHGLSAFIVDLVDRGYITHVACNGSVLVHDWELAIASETSEDVPYYIRDGKFGHWDVQGQINDAIWEGHDTETTIGEILGRYLQQREVGLRYSVLRVCYEAGVPMTSHLLVGGDVFGQHPNCSHSVFAASYVDFRAFAYTVSQMDGGGVFVNVGTQSSGPEIFLKALSMARNLARRDGAPLIHNIVTGVADFMRLPANWRAGETSEDDPAYYYRPWKTILLRTVREGGRSFYLCGPHVETIPPLWKSIVHG